MVVEHFRDGDPLPVYRRFRDRGRLAPDGLQYVSSWVDEKLATCFQLMETDDRDVLDQWMANWNDIVEFEVYAVMSSKDAAERVAWRERCGESCVARVMRRKLRGDSSGSVWAERRRRSLIEAHGWSFAITMGLRKTKQGGTLKALAMGTKRRTVRQRFQR